MMVVANGRLEGIVSLRDLSRLIALKLDLEDENGYE